MDCLRTGYRTVSVHNVPRKMGSLTRRSESQEEVFKLDEWELERRFAKDKLLTGDIRSRQASILNSIKRDKTKEIPNLGVPQLNLDLLLILDRPSRINKLRFPNRLNRTENPSQLSSSEKKTFSGNSTTKRTRFPTISFELQSNISKSYGHDILQETSNIIVKANANLTPLETHTDGFQTHTTNNNNTQTDMLLTQRAKAHPWMKIKGFERIEKKRKGLISTEDRSPKQPTSSPPPLNSKHGYFEAKTTSSFKFDTTEENFIQINKKKKESTSVFAEIGDNIDANIVDEFRAKIIQYKQKRNELMNILSKKTKSLLSKVQKSSEYNRKRETFMKSLFIDIGIPKLTKVRKKSRREKLRVI